MLQIIPWRNLPNWQQEIVLDQVIYHLSFHWNALNEFWTMDIFSRDQVPLILGIKLVVNYNLTAQYVNNALFPGSILVIDFSSDVESIERLDMGNRVQLVYQDVTDVI